MKVLESETRKIKCDFKSSKKQNKKKKKKNIVAMEKIIRKFEEQS